MNILQIIALVLGAAVMPGLGPTIGWLNVAIVLAVISGIALYVSFPSLFEQRALKTDTNFPFLQLLKQRLSIAAISLRPERKHMRFFATGMLQTDILFYLKYSLKVDEGLAGVILGLSFLVAGFSLYPWRNWVANKLDSRRTLMLANAIMILGIVPMGFSPNIYFTYATALIVGIGLGGLVLIGDVIMTEVVDEDEVSTGHQRVGMYKPAAVAWDVWDITPLDEKGAPTSLDQPGGMQSDGKRLWIPLAESRRQGRSLIRAFHLRDLEAGRRLQPALEFAVTEHIGALAVSVERDLLLGASWDTEKVHVWNLQGGSRRTLTAADL